MNKTGGASFNSLAPPIDLPQFSKNDLEPVPCATCPAKTYLAIWTCASIFVVLKQPCVMVRKGNMMRGEIIFQQHKNLRKVSDVTNT